MKVVVDLDRCEAHGECTRIAPDLFRLDEELDLHWEENPPGDRSDDVRYAVEACPSEAISVDEV
ncbi:MAG: ferredoxin [Actinobacteria bacterium]|nr:ferredoxin [Actinomycetota bacterium]